MHSTTRPYRYGTTPRPASAWTTSHAVCRRFGYPPARWSRADLHAGRLADLEARIEALEADRLPRQADTRERAG